jgi:hypothetical protein
LCLFRRHLGLRRADVRSPIDRATDLDEFQELSGFDQSQAVKRSFGSVYSMLREEWQAQRNCNYIVSGSAISMLRQIIEDPSAPFFQHFTPLHLGPLPAREAVGLLAGFSRRSGATIELGLCRRITALVGTTPYGCRRPKPGRDAGRVRSVATA